MIGMLLNVVHRQVHQRKNRTKESDGFHNYSTLLTGIEEAVRTDRTIKTGLCFLVI